MTTPIHCANCGGRVTLQFADWKAEHVRLAAWLQAWVCPYCMAKNEGRFPGLLAWVTKGHAGTPKA